MDLIAIYQCLCDQTRLRVINLLGRGPLCVCHFQELLDESQVKISKHLAYLRSHGMVEATREANWMVYRLPARPSPELKANLACLQDCAREHSVFQADLAKLRKLHGRFADTSPICCPPAKAQRPARRRAATGNAAQPR